MRDVVMWGEKDVMKHVEMGEVGGAEMDVGQDV